MRRLAPLLLLALLGAACGGDTGTVRLKNGVLTEPITGATYCGLNVAICGA
jgi:hypothetical protein